MAMKLSTGKVAFPIEFDNGDKDVIYFNPNDRDFINRANDFEKSINERIKNINLERYKSQFESDVNIDIDLTDINAIDKLSKEEVKELQKRMSAVVDLDKEYQKAVKDELDDIFKSNISSVVFKYCEPFDAVIITDEKGEEVSEMFIIVFLNEFAKALRKHQEKVAPAMQKHIGKYKN